MSETSEEKSLPATARKLREARRKGQVAKSQDLVSGVAVLAATILLVFNEGAIQKRIEALLELAATAHERPFADVWPRIFDVATHALAETMLPLMAVVVAMVVLVNFGAMKGIVFSAEPLVPKFEKINPVDGFKRIFSMRGIVEFLKGVVKVAALALAFTVIFRLGLESLFNAPACGPSCIRASFQGILTPLVATAVIALLAVGLVDLLLQNWLFGREMRMTKTERKRELRDAEGDPAIRRQRARDRRGSQVASSKTGLSNASLVIGSSGGPVVGIRYVRGETPVPIVVCRAPPDESRAMIADAVAKNIPVIEDRPLSEDLARGAMPGRPIHERTFQRVADHLVAARAI